MEISQTDGARNLNQSDVANSILLKQAEVSKEQNAYNSAVADILLSTEIRNLASYHRSLSDAYTGEERLDKRHYDGLQVSGIDINEQLQLIKLISKTSSKNIFS